MVSRFENGELTPLPTQTFPCDEADKAFRFMQQAKHIGKVVIDYESKPTEVLANDESEVKLKPNRSYWVAGGMGGFGLRVARWLAERGAKHVILGGRSSTISDEICEKVGSIESEFSCSIRHLPVDLSDLQSVRNVVEQIEAVGPPLAGVFHTAMVLEDRLLIDLDRRTLDRVLQPKVQGGWNLHEATGDCELDCFVLFSSLSSIFGHAGQANYSAANAFLDSLAHHRRFIGLHGVAINWGHVGEVGYLAARGELSQRLERQGVLTFSADEAMRCLEYALANDITDQSVLRMDWTKWRGLGITGEVPPKFAHLLRNKTEPVKPTDRLASYAEVRQAEGEERRSMIGTIVAQKTASLLGIETEDLPWDRPLLTLGLDSLMAVEMRNWIESRLQIDLPISDLMRAEGLNELTDLATDLFSDENASVKETSAAELLEQITDMSDESVDALLAKLIEEPEGESGVG